MHRFNWLVIGLLTVIQACRTLDPMAEDVVVAPKAEATCRPLGVVAIDWAWWGFSTERLNVLRNQTAELGGNSVVLVGDSMGYAYKCPEERF